jgi:citrate/tricarballylate utilization protein
LVVALTAAAAVALFIGGFVALGDAKILFTIQTGPGAFYRLMPHDTMVLLFGSVFVFAMLALTMSVRTFWHTIGGGPLTLSDVLDAGRAAATLQYLSGGGGGCRNEEERSDDRRFFHHCTFYGFLLCFASTSLATVLHNGFGWQAPYSWYNPVVLFGIVGGLGLLIGPVGLLRAKGKRDLSLTDTRVRGMEVGFLVMLLLTSATGLLLLVLRATPTMGMLLALHLGVVFALFLSFPYGKFVHGFYRYAALVRFAQEKRTPVNFSDNA